MSQILVSWPAANSDSGVAEELVAVSPASQQDLELVKQTWSPILRKRAMQAAAALAFVSTADRDQLWRDKLGMLGCPDAHWNWLEKCADIDGTSTLSICIRSAANVEGVLKAHLNGQSRLKQGNSLLYIDNIAVAPWNRVQIQAPPRFSRIGTALFGLAVAKSVELGMQGRCGLHSLQQSEAFYEKLGMTCLGPDGRLKYFELSSDAALQLLENSK